MLTFLAVIHVILCLLLIALVLLQDPKGGAAGGIFGGGGANTLLGATGATTFLTKFTRGVAIAFGVLCLVMTWYLKRDSGSVIDRVAPANAQSAPAAPTTVPAQDSGSPAAGSENPTPENKK